MSTCSYCGCRESMPYICKFCGSRFCSNHRLPENHQCIGLQSFKETRGKEIEKWIYEPFQEKFKDVVGREVKEPLTDRISKALKNINARKILYIILLFIIFILIWEGILKT